MTLGGNLGDVLQRLIKIKVEYMGKFVGDIFLFKQGTVFVWKIGVLLGMLDLETGVGFQLQMISGQVEVVFCSLISFPFLCLRSSGSF